MSPRWLLIKKSEAIHFKKNFSRAVDVLCDCSHKSVCLFWAKHTRMCTFNESSCSKKFCWPRQAITQQILQSLHLELFSESIFKSLYKFFFEMSPETYNTGGWRFILKLMPTFHFSFGLLVTWSSFLSRILPWRKQLGRHWGHSWEGDMVLIDPLGRGAPAVHFNRHWGDFCAWQFIRALQE